MTAERICFSSKTVDIVEFDLYLELVNRLCYYDYKNLNDVMLPYKDTEEQALAFAQTLINMPVQAKYRKINKQDDLGSHEMYIDKDGDVCFGTDSVGTHISVEIKEDTIITVDGHERTLPCLFATCRIWKRNKNMIAAIKRLYESNAGLHTSWEIETSEYEYKNGVKILTNYAFFANTLLGSTTPAAYSDTSKTLSLASIADSELMVAEALSQDIMESLYTKNNATAKEDYSLKDNEKTIANGVEDQVTETPVAENPDTPEASGSKENPTTEPVTSDNGDGMSTENPTADVSALTSYDLRIKISEACRNAFDSWCWVSYLFPEDHLVWCEYDGESELDYLQFSYAVDNDVVSVSEPTKVKLTVSVSEINERIAELEKTIAEKDELIVDVSSEISNLKSANAELSQYKEKFEEVEQKKVEAEMAEKKKQLIASVVKSGQITEDEIAQSEELSGYVNALDKKSLMAIVGERLSAAIEAKPKQTIDTDSIDLSAPSANLNSIDDESDSVSIMKRFLHN